MIIIEKDIEIPSIIGRGKKHKWPLGDLQVGDSIALANEVELKSIRNAANRYKRMNDEWDYGATKYEDGSGRLWRTN